MWTWLKKRLANDSIEEMRDQTRQGRIENTRKKKVPVGRIDGNVIVTLIKNLFEAKPVLYLEFYAQVVHYVIFSDSIENSFDENCNTPADRDFYFSAAPGFGEEELNGITPEVKGVIETEVIKRLAKFIYEDVSFLKTKMDGELYEARDVALDFFESGRALSILRKDNATFFDDIFHESITLRSRDIDMLRNELENRRKKLLPLFKRAYFSGENQYGDFDDKPYYDEIDKFLNYIFDDLDTKFFPNEVSLQPPAYDLVGQWMEEGGVTGVEASHEDGYQFEVYVAELLIRHGWTASVTQAGGDNGVDIVAEKDGLSMAIQCKRYKGSVGNQAVQEVYAGMKHMALSRAAVISTGRYTKGAKGLAATTGVLLLTEYDIPHLGELLGV